MRTYSYPATFEPGDNPSAIVVTFADIPEAITEGQGEADARMQAADALGLALLAYLRADRRLPKPGKGTIMISPPADVAAKIAVIETFRNSGLTRVEVARRIGRDEKVVRRILDPMHSTDLSSLSAALNVMNARLVVGVEAA
jgi:antitoxin HicB